MSKTPEQVQAMKDAIQAWMEKHDLTHDTAWHDVENYFKGEDITSWFTPYLVLSCDGPLCDVLRHSGDSEWLGEREVEFHAILDAHGFWFDFVLPVVIVILD